MSAGQMLVELGVGVVSIAVYNMVFRAEWFWHGPVKLTPLDALRNVIVSVLMIHLYRLIQR